MLGLRGPRRSKQAQRSGSKCPRGDDAPRSTYHIGAATESIISRVRCFRKKKTPGMSDPHGLPPRPPISMLARAVPWSATGPAKKKTFFVLGGRGIPNIEMGGAGGKAEDERLLGSSPASFFSKTPVSPSSAFIPKTPDVPHSHTQNTHTHTHTGEERILSRCKGLAGDFLSIVEGLRF